VLSTAFGWGAGGITIRAPEITLRSRGGPMFARVRRGQLGYPQNSPTSAEHLMKNNEQTVRFDLTPEQKEQVKKATNKDVEAVELTVNELEERIAPRAILFRQ
jgi:6-phosphogluconate dehydrogenase (decarboxylating)